MRASYTVWKNTVWWEERGDGMRLLQVNNGRGLAFTVSADRCADISRLSLDGVELWDIFRRCGYVAPAYYDHVGDGFLKSFVLNFLDFKFTILILSLYSSDSSLLSSCSEYSFVTSLHA